MRFSLRYLAGRHGGDGSLHRKNDRVCPMFTLNLRHGVTPSSSSGCVISPSQYFGVSSAFMISIQQGGPLNGKMIQRSSAPLSQKRFALDSHADPASRDWTTRREGSPGWRIHGSAGTGTSRSLRWVRPLGDYHDIKMTGIQRWRGKCKGSRKVTSDENYGG